MKFVLLLLALASCAAESREIRGPDGATWIAITCRRSQENCYEEAGDQCPYGYTVGDASGHHDTVVSGSRYGVYAVPVYNGELLVKCKRRPKGAPIADDD